jgi:hypothetical protein
MAQLGFGLKIDDTAQENGYDRYEKNLLETLGAIASDNWEYNPLEATKTHRSINAANTESIRGGDVRVDRNELNKEYNSLGLYFKEDEFQSVVDIMVEKKEAERERQSIIQRGPAGSWNPFSAGFYVGAAKFGTGLAVSMLDPINIGASFIPVFGQARFAALAARQGLRTARLTRGVVEGAVGAALVEPIVYSAAKRVQADYGAADSLLNIAFGSILGGGLHVGVGKLRDIKTVAKYKNFRTKVNEVRKETGIKSDEVEPELTNEQILFREYYGDTSDFMLKLEKTDPRTRKLLLEKSLGDLLLDEPVDVGPVINADPVLRTTENSIPTVERNNQPRLKSDEVELNTAEQNVARRNETETDAEIDTLNSQLETLKNNQKDANFKFQPGDEEAELKVATEELDEINTKKKEIDEVVADFINCRNGR